MDFGYGCSNLNIFSASREKRKHKKGPGYYPDERHILLRAQKHLQILHHLRRQKRIASTAQNHEQSISRNKRNALCNLLKIPVDFSAENHQKSRHKTHRNGIHVQAQEIGKLVNVRLHG